MHEDTKIVMQKNTLIILKDIDLSQYVLDIQEFGY